MADFWTTQWTITPSTLQTLAGEKHTLPVADHGLMQPSLWRVTKQTSHRAHQVVERYARYFRREFDYDVVQYCAEEPYRLSETQAWLWTSWEYEGYGILGAACCRWRTYTNLAESFWGLQWVWLHPYARHKGLFTAAWPIILRHYGELHLEPPVSSAMQHIVRHTPTTALTATNGHQVVLHGTPTLAHQEAAHA